MVKVAVIGLESWLRCSKNSYENESFKSVQV